MSLYGTIQSSLGTTITTYDQDEISLEVYCRNHWKEIAIVQDLVCGCQSEALTSGPRH